MNAENVGPLKEGTRVVLREITASLHNSPMTQSPRRKSGTDHPTKTGEHEVKVRFAREFADVGSVSYSTPGTLSSASSFHSVSSSLSTKSSNGLYSDSPRTPDIANSSYVNSDIPGVEDLILACADIRLGDNEKDRSFGVDSQDLSQDQTFTSATDEPPLDTTGEIVQVYKESSSHDVTPVGNNTSIHDGPRVDFQDRPILVNTICTANSLTAAEKSVTDTLSAKTEETVEVSGSLDEDSRYKTCNISNDPVENSQNCCSVEGVCKTSVNESNSNTVETRENTIETTQDLERITSNNTLPSIINSLPSIITLIDNTECPSLPNISSTSSLAENKSETPAEVVETEIKPVEYIADNATAVVTKPETGNLSSNTTIPELTKLSQRVLESITVKQEEDKVAEEAEEHLPDTCEKFTNKTNNLEQLSDIHTKKTPQLQEPLTVEEPEVEDTSVVKHTETIEEPCKETLNDTLTLDDAPVESLSVPEVEKYDEFKPPRQSTCLTALDSHFNFEELQSAAEKIANDISNSSLELPEENDPFDIFQDPKSFDFLLAKSNSNSSNRLRTESLYIKFDPLLSSTSMLPQGNTQAINEEQNGKNETSPPVPNTPKRNPAIAAIDRLLFYSPVSSGTIQKSEELSEKTEQPKKESKPDAPLIADINMDKELELVRSTVLQLEEELEKQKKEHESELEKQKTTFQEKINKLQTQMAQETKSKGQMAVVVEEYEKSISRLFAERERDRTNMEQEKKKLQEEIGKLQEELQAANHHLTNTEAAFNDVHLKYERLKGVVSAYKSNEAVLKESIQENEETIKALENRYEILKTHAMAQLEKANLELDAIRKQHEAETVKLHAMVRKAELKSNSLAEVVEQKTKENKELTRILDEVIARVGHQNAE